MFFEDLNEVNNIYNLLLS